MFLNKRFSCILIVVLSLQHFLLIISHKSFNEAVNILQGDIDLINECCHDNKLIIIMRIKLNQCIYVIDTLKKMIY
jgi:hypothetical protein